MNWTYLEDQQQTENIKLSKGYSLIFKHSTRCSVSLFVKKSLELDADLVPGNVPIYFLDLLRYRNISNSIAEQFQVHHESPQLLLIKDGECVFESSHGEISMEEMVGQISGKQQVALATLPPYSPCFIFRL